MDDTTAERANCPGCGAPLELTSDQAVVTCPYCGSDAKVVRRLRSIEPDLPLVPPPSQSGNPAAEFDRWNTEQLVHGILNDQTLDRRVAMAKALDAWSHVGDEAADYVPCIVETMLGAPPELDKALSGILGKLVCSKSLRHRQRVIAAGRAYGFRGRGSKGLVFALSLGDAGSVKLLLDIAEWADSTLNEPYATEALIGVQTAIGREKDRRRVCVEILLYRFLYVSPFIQQWIAKYLRNYFDVGYHDVREAVLDLLEDCVHENPQLVSKLVAALKKCGRADDRDEFRRRLHHLQTLKTVEARRAACMCLGHLPNDGTADDRALAAEMLGSFTDAEDDELRTSASEALNRLA